MKRNEMNKWSALIAAAVDGEVEAAERERLERQLETSAECRSLLEALQEMGEILRFRMEVAADAADLDSLWPRIAAELDTAPAVEPIAEIDALTLQAFVDGELSGTQLARVSDQVAQSKTSRGQVKALAEMGELLRVSAESAADSVDFSQLWSRLDASVGEEIEARGGFQLAQPRPERRPSLFERMIMAIGGYRTVLASAATAVVLLAVLIPALINRGDDESATPVAADPAQLEIRVVHVNEFHADPGYAVTVDTGEDPASNVAPVIYIRPNASDADQETGPEGNPEFYGDPI
jgi:anti-sigma factor RsiW